MGIFTINKKKQNTLQAARIKAGKTAACFLLKVNLNIQIKTKIFCSKSSPNNSIYSNSNLLYFVFVRIIC